MSLFITADIRFCRFNASRLQPLGKIAYRIAQLEAAHPTAKPCRPDTLCSQMLQSRRLQAEQRGGVRLGYSAIERRFYFEPDGLGDHRRLGSVDALGFVVQLYLFCSTLSAKDHGLRLFGVLQCPPLVTCLPQTRHGTRGTLNRGMGSPADWVTKIATAHESRATAHVGLARRRR